jgi:hypothetical protein
VAALTKRQCRSLVYRYFLNDGWLPPGTTMTNWDQVTLGSMGIDDPAVPGAPDVQKERIALDLQNLCHVVGSDVASPLAQLEKDKSTLGDLAEWLFGHQS